MMRPQRPQPSKTPLTATKALSELALGCVSTVICAGFALEYLRGPHWAYGLLPLAGGIVQIIALPRTWKQYRQAKNTGIRPASSAVPPAFSVPRFLSVIAVFVWILLLLICTLLLLIGTGIAGLVIYSMLKPLNWNVLWNFPVALLFLGGLWIYIIQSWRSIFHKEPLSSPWMQRHMPEEGVWPPQPIIPPQEDSSPGAPSEHF